jgi:hypothetical protein
MCHSESKASLVDEASAVEPLNTGSILPPLGNKAVGTTAAAAAGTTAANRRYGRTTRGPVQQQQQSQLQQQQLQHKALVMAKGHSMPKRQQSHQHASGGAQSARGAGGGPSSGR